MNVNPLCTLTLHKLTTNEVLRVPSRGAGALPVRGQPLCPRQRGCTQRMSTSRGMECAPELGETGQWHDEVEGAVEAAGVLNLG